MKKWKTRVLKTRIFKGTIGSNTSVESDRKSESELETSNDIYKKEKPESEPGVFKIMIKMKNPSFENLNL